MADRVAIAEAGTMTIVACTSPGSAASLPREHELADAAQWLPHSMRIE